LHVASCLTTPTIWWAIHFTSSTLALCRAITTRFSISAGRAGHLIPVLPVVGLPPLSRQAVPALPGLQRDGVCRLIGCRLYVAVEVGRGHSRR
jgi:hypothetical protein